MTFHQPILVQPSSGDASLVTTGQEFRQYTKAVMGMADISGAQGVISSASLPVVQHAAGANFSVDIGSGVGFVVGDDVTQQGTYQFYNDGTVNVATPSPPATGTENHRLVVQIEDHLENSAWSPGTYTATPLLLADTGSGTPAEPGSAITLAIISIASGQANVSNANITDYRIICGGALGAYTPTDVGRTGTSLTTDPNLQLNNLAPGAWYEIRSVIDYTGGTGAFEGDFAWTFATGASASGLYADQHVSIAGVNTSPPPLAWPNASNWTDSRTAGTGGISTILTVVINGMLKTGNNRPQFLQLQWGQNTNVGTNTTVKVGSYLVAKRLA